ncbi:MAG: hypothetical protein LBQ74_13960 [Prevotella sp.]|jgi:hypothetical protein|nr:hypothetical protein [Prevotella sp.]
MKYIIKRTSLFLSEQKPYDEAFLTEEISYDYRCSKTIKEAKDKHWFESWYNNTTDHIEVSGYIRGTEKEKRQCWAINIETLDDLMKFQAKYGSLIITNSYFNNDLLMIEIYDDYRE